MLLFPFDMNIEKNTYWSEEGLMNHLLMRTFVTCTEDDEEATSSAATSITWNQPHKFNQGFLRDSITRTRF